MTIPNNKLDIILPRSAVGWFDALIALPVILGIFFGARHLASETMSNSLFLVVMIAALGVVMGAVEISRAPWRFYTPLKASWTAIVGRAFVKLLGFFAALSTIIFFYWLFPEYRREYYGQFFSGALLVLPWLPFMVIPYFIYVEKRLPYEKGGAWEMAMFVLGKWRGIDWHVLSSYVLGWMVKGFFLPIMFGDLGNNIGYLRTADWNIFALEFVPVFELLFLALINLELIFVTAGYVFTCRLFDSHIRDVERTLFGWFIALISYGPFLGLVYGRYFAYNPDDVNWIDWLSAHPTILVLWGSVILALLVIHLWCDACFGLRFSNLTNRGIITNGPYRFSKHPAYVIKNIRWWMVAVPFISGMWSEALRLSLLLVCVNLVYTLRAYAEERMLSRDLTYVAYAKWMDSHGLLRGIGKRFPIFSYEWRLNYWRSKGIITTP